ncbi:DUF1553 domain-containing protein [Flexithrix dorotheae]|uniref:DUF1553 domain-containing protein n=1 Tax=Flexithrix dorotheae TaxID=70993 RepID=UPI0003603C53|nr:DUF1553 domain-containing protein [Flexithrix dorotheae]
MKRIRYKLLSLIGCCVFLFQFISCQEDKISFNKEIRPILNKNCISCHGGVKQSGGFGMVFRENALKETESGVMAIVPGEPNKSEIIKRIRHHDPELRMPLEAEPLKEEEIELIEKWIAQGAEWEEHWAFIPPKSIQPPAIDSPWVKNEIDQFVMKKLVDNQITPSKVADPYTLIRRLSLDITGLPPTQDQVNRFLADSTYQNYERLADEMLNSPKYGEHWASMWLDLARYADSRGYEKDSYRSIWQYRDWVVKAFNSDMPFDQFTIEQLAGDLLPNPSIDQLIATGFHRNSVSNDEGGSDNEEFRVASVIDRVNTTWEVWQGITMGCVQCHSHPYDPIKLEEFYTSYAFFNNSTDGDLPHDLPQLRTFEGEDSTDLEEIKSWIVKNANEEESNKWERIIRTKEPMIRPLLFSDFDNVSFQNRGDQDFMVVLGGAFIKLSDVDLSKTAQVYLQYYRNDKEPAEVVVRKDSVNGEKIGEFELGYARGWGNLTLSGTEILQSNETTDLYLVFEGEKNEYKCTVDGILLTESLPGKNLEGYQHIQAMVDSLLIKKGGKSTAIVCENPEKFQRKTHVFMRGNWMVTGQEVTPAVPGIFDSIPANKTANRLSFAQWLVDGNNPLTSRVITNRFWNKIFGKGIISSVEDFGAQGEAPSHPELLDWLALKFSDDYQWSVKKLVKLIVMSNTYRQSSSVSPELLEKDPNNVFLARAPRVRLSAEQVRDQALMASGLLSDKMYGPSVMPTQPEGVWQVVYSGLSWKTSEGEDKYRRGLYTYLRRSSPYPSFITFDASNREFCLSRRIRTNTPLQALVTLNDSVYFETAQVLAKEMQNTSAELKEQLEHGYQKLLFKPLTKEKSQILETLFHETYQYYEENNEEAKIVTGTDDIQLAALIIVANSLMNLDEVIVKS